MICVLLAVSKYLENSAENVQQRRMDDQDNSFDSLDCK